ncbi:hypothetical protein VTK73DRAFT_74 [Phialemonium thermophilum]|uniref:Major facilitator superfamily (MFS) profile domain-containing protein n=1 Tax=Phialemonium thermophilum TaxID=223376 RepID=A0ABR3Y7U2_9PEZI
MSNQEEPLISHADDGTHDDADSDGAPFVPKSVETAPGMFIWLLTLSACISGLLFGYDTGVISATLVSIDKSLSGRELTSLNKSIITSATALFALFVSPFSSFIADSLGRRRVLLLADFLFGLGAVLQALSTTVTGMVVGRAAVGAAVGAASFVTPLYIAELAPARHRGLLVTINVLFVTFGQVVAYVSGWAFSEYGSKATGWRWLVGLGAVPAAVQNLLVLFMPESPRWLVKVGLSSEARLVIGQVAGGGRNVARLVEATLDSIEAEVREEEEARRLSRSHASDDRWGWTAPLRELLATRKNRRALAIACLLQGLQQLCGFNSLMYFSATIFTLLGFRTPTLTSLVVAFTNLIFTILALLLIDRIGRRRILLWSIPFMIVGLLLSAWGFSFINNPSDTNFSVGFAGGGTVSQNRDVALLIVFSIMVYVASYAIGLGNVPWMQSELFPLSVRAVGAGIATGTNWGANFIIGLTFLPLMSILTPPWTFTMYAVICLAGYLLIWRIYPETAGLSLEEASSLLEADNWGVR